MTKIIFSIMLCLSVVVNITGQERDNSFLIFPFGYDFFRMEGQSIHRPAVGAGFMMGEQNLPFDEVERRILAIGIYQPLFFTEIPQPNVPKHLHEISVLIDGQINRNQLLFIFKSSADKPIAGGVGTFQAGIGWGYEIIRKPHISFIFGAALGVSDFGLSLPLLPLPLVRFNVSTQWFNSSFDFLTGPNLKFTIAPKERFRFTADMRMDHFRSINDLIYEYILWYRFFGESHRLGDFAGLGIGVKNDSMDYFISQNSTNFELQQSSIIAVIDISLLKIKCGWIYNSNYLINGNNVGNSGNGFFISVQGIIPIATR